MVAALALLLSGCWRPSFTADYTVTVIKDIVYGRGEVNGGGSFKNLTLDLYAPQGTGQSQLPLVVVIHGGGFVSGSKSQSNVVDWAQAFAQRGYLVASIEYRLQGDDPIPSARVQPIYDAVLAMGGDPQSVTAVAAMDDTLTALDYLHSLPQVQAVNTVLVGGSAGAVTADYVAYALDDFGIERPPVRAVVSNWGGFVIGGASTYINNTIINEPPYLYAEPPIFLAHTTDDPTVPYALSTDIATQTQAVGIDHVLYAKTAATHGFNTATEQYSPGRTVLQAQVDFVTCSLFPESPPDPACTF